MKNFPKLIALALVMCFGAVPHSAIAQTRSPDRVGLDQLASTGSDLKKVHQVDFYLHFPTQKAAERVAVRLVSLAFISKTQPGKNANDWVVVASKRMFPVESDLMGLRDKLNVVAAEEGGVYERWQAQIADKIVE